MTQQTNVTDRFATPGDLLERLLALFRRLGSPICYRTGEKVLMHPDQPGYLIIESGTVRVEMFGSGRRSGTPFVQFREAGEIIDPSALLGPSHENAVVRAHTETLAYALPAQAVNDLLQDQPADAAMIFDALARSAAASHAALSQYTRSMLPGQIDPDIDRRVQAAVSAQQQFSTWPAGKVRDLVVDLAEALTPRSVDYARLAVQATGMGNVHDKATKNRFACMGALTGIFDETDLRWSQGTGMLTYHSPVGVIFSVVPGTNPVASTIFSVLCGLRSTNAIILSPNQIAKQPCETVVADIRAFLSDRGAPEALVSMVGSRMSRSRIRAFMEHDQVNLVLATGGRELVDVAHRSGTPTLAAGPGNTPALICDDADQAAAAGAIVRSKSFDNGLVCGGESNLIVQQSIEEPFLSELARAGCALLSAAEFRRLNQLTSGDGTLGPQCTGQSAASIASQAGIHRPYGIRMLVVRRPADQDPGSDKWLAEKLAPIVSLTMVPTFDDGVQLARRLLLIDGTGHTAVIHTTSNRRAQQFGIAVPANRILVNSPASQGIVGVTTDLDPSVILGCGTDGGSTTTDNITHHHLANKKRLALHTNAGETMLDWVDHINPGAVAVSGALGLEIPESEALGCSVWDEQGNEYLDFLAGVGVMNVGHRHPEVVDAVKRQLDKMPLTSRVMLNAQQAALARKLAQCTPGDLRFSFFSNSGAESVEAAIKFARHATGRHKIIAMNNSFHGKTLGALSASGRPVFKDPFVPLVPGFEHVAFGNIDELRSTLREDTAAVILEPVQGEGGVIIPPDDYLRAVRNSCDSVGALLILDEVQTGIGRCGSMFACEQYDVIPDILCLAKGLSGGVIPIGVTVGTSRVWTMFDSNAFLHSSTFGGNPLACAAAIACLNIVERDELCVNAARQGKYLLEKLTGLKEKYPELLVDVRGKGLLIGLEFTDDRIAVRIIHRLVRHRILAAYTLNQPSVIRLEPPLIVTQEQCDRVLTALASALAEDVLP